jgi:uncharacterized protein (UPF0333 family)
MLHFKVSDREQISAAGSFLTLVLALAAGMVVIGFIFFYAV